MVPGAVNGMVTGLLMYAEDDELHALYPEVVVLTTSWVPVQVNTTPITLVTISQ